MRIVVFRGESQRVARVERTRNEFEVIKLDFATMDEVFTSEQYAYHYGAMVLC